MTIEKIETNLTENTVSITLAILDEDENGEIKRRIHRMGFLNSLAQRELLASDTLLSDEHKQKIFDFWGDEPTVDENLDK